MTWSRSSSELHGQFEPLLLTTTSEKLYDTKEHVHIQIRFSNGFLNSSNVLSNDKLATEGKMTTAYVSQGNGSRLVCGAGADCKVAKFKFLWEMKLPWASLAKLLSPLLFQGCFTQRSLVEGWDVNGTNPHNP